MLLVEAFSLTSGGKKFYRWINPEHIVECYYSEYYDKSSDKSVPNVLYVEMANGKNYFIQLDRKRSVLTTKTLQTLYEESHNRVKTPMGRPVKPNI